MGSFDHGWLRGARRVTNPHLREGNVGISIQKAQTSHMNKKTEGI